MINLCVNLIKNMNNQIFSYWVVSLYITSILSDVIWTRISCIVVHCHHCCVNIKKGFRTIATISSCCCSGGHVLFSDAPRDCPSRVYYCITMITGNWSIYGLHTSTLPFLVLLQLVAIYGHKMNQYFVHLKKYI